MTDSSAMAVVKQLAKPLYNIAKVAGPFILSQSGKYVENYSNYKLNKARLEAISLLLIEEVKNISADRAKLRDKIINASGIERVRAQNDYDLLTREINKLSTVDKVKDFIGQDEEIQADDTMSDSWIGRFNDLASTLNEEWRKSLLAKAFSMELKHPNSINILVLNAIASFDESTFRYFGAFVNMSVRLYEVNCLPPTVEDLNFNINDMEIPGHTMLYKIGHLNLINRIGGTYLNLSDTEPSLLRYGRKILKIKSKTRPIPPAYQINVFFFSPLGNDMAKLYDRELNDNGFQALEYIKSMAINANYLLDEIELPDDLYNELGN